MIAEGALRQPARSPTWRWRGCGPGCGRSPAGRRRSRPRRLRRVRHRRPVDPGGPGRRRARPGLPQRVPAPGHPAGRARCGRADRFTCRYHGWSYDLDGAAGPRARSGRLHRPARRPGARRGAGRLLRRVRVRERRPRRRAAPRLPRPHPHDPRSLPAGGHALPVLRHHRAARQLEGRASTPSTRGTTSRGRTPRSCPGPTTSRSPTSSSTPTPTTAGWTTRRGSSAPAPGSGWTTTTFDEGEILAGHGGRPRRGLPGRRAAHRRRAAGRRPRAGASCSPPTSSGGWSCSASRGFDVSGFTARPDDQRGGRLLVPQPGRPHLPGQRASCSGCGPTVSTPTAPSRTSGSSSGRRRDDEWEMPERRFYPDWTAKEWDPVTAQDYANLAEVQTGMRSEGFDGLRLNPRQEGNIALMHRVIDRYLADLAFGPRGPGSQARPSEPAGHHADGPADDRPGHDAGGPGRHLVEAAGHAQGLALADRRRAPPRPRRRPTSRRSRARRSRTRLLAAGTRCG